MSLFDRELPPDADAPGEKLPELFDIHVMLFAGDPRTTVAALAKIFGIDEVLAQRIVEQAPITVKRAVQPEAGGQFVDILNAVGAQVVLMPTDPDSSAYEDAVSLPEPSAEIQATAASSGGWGALDLELPGAILVAPGPGAYSLDSAGGLADLDIPVRPAAGSAAATQVSPSAYQISRASPGAYHEEGLREAPFAELDLAPQTSLPEGHGTEREAVRPHDAPSAAFADLIERYTIDELDAPMADVLGGEEMQLGHSDPAPPPLGDDLLDVDAPSAELFGGDSDGDELDRDRGDSNFAGSQLSPAVAAALRMPVRGTRRSGRRIARDAPPHQAAAAAPNAVVQALAGTLAATASDMLMAAPDPIAPAGDPVAGGAGAMLDLGLGDVPPLPSLPGAPPLPPPVMQHGAPPSLPGVAPPPLRPGGAAPPARPARPSPPSLAAPDNPLPPPPSKKKFSHREFDQSDAMGLPALNLATDTGAAQPLPLPGGAGGAGGAGGGSYWSARTGAVSDPPPARRGDPTPVPSGAAPGAKPDAVPSLAADDDPNEGKFQLKHVEVPDTTSAPMRAMGLIGSALCVLVMGIYLDNTILFGNATPVSLGMHAYFFFGLGTGLAELHTR